MFYVPNYYLWLYRGFFYDKGFWFINWKLFCNVVGYWVKPTGECLGTETEKFNLLFALPSNWNLVLVHFFKKILLEISLLCTVTYFISICISSLIEALSICFIPTLLFHDSAFKFHDCMGVIESVRIKITHKCLVAHEPKFKWSYNSYYVASIRNILCKLSLNAYS
jgi:hypothetical protein